MAARVLQEWGLKIKMERWLVLIGKNTMLEMSLWLQQIEKICT